MDAHIIIVQMYPNSGREKRNTQDRVKPPTPGSHEMWRNLEHQLTTITRIVILDCYIVDFIN